MPVQFAAQNNAIAYVELGSPFSFLKEQSDLSGIGYAAYQDADRLYFGTNTGLYRKEKNESVLLTLVDNSKGQVYNIGRYNDDLLISHQKGALRVEGNTATSLSSEPGSWMFLALKDHPEKLICPSESTRRHVFLGLCRTRVR